MLILNTQKLSILLLLLFPVSSSGISSDTGEILGYTYTGITILLLFCYSLLSLSKYSSKGSLMLVSQIFIFTSFCRYSALINFDHSSFFESMWRSFSKAQDPYEILTCTKTNKRWAMLGFETNNFVCNSFAYGCVVAGLILAWIGCFIVLKDKRQLLKRFWVFLAYCSVSDLSLSAFVQVYDIDFSDGIGIAGTCAAIFYLALVLAMLGFQCYFIYQEKFDSFLIESIKEDFIPDKEYYFYYFYPLLMLKVLVHMCILVFAESKRYSAPVVVSIMNLINCNSQSVSYIISIQPFAYQRHSFFVFFIQVIEIIFMFLPIMYEINSIPDLAIDLTSISLFILGLFSFPLRTYTDYSSSKRLSPIQINPASSNQVGNDDFNSSSLDLVKSPGLDSAKGFNATFKLDDFSNFKNDRKSPQMSKLNDIKTSDSKDNQSSIQIIKKTPPIFAFGDNESVKDFGKYEENVDNMDNMEKTANFPSNEVKRTMRPLNYASLYESSFANEDGSRVLPSGDGHFSNLARVRKNLNDVTVKTRKDF